MIEGAIQLEQVYAASFEYAITKSNITTALQQVKNDNSSSNQLFDEYKGVFYLNTRDCERDLRTDQISFTEKGFIDITNRYNSCLNNDYIFQSEERLEKVNYELEIYTGQTNSDIDFFTKQTRSFNNLVLPEPDYQSKYKKSSAIVFGASLKRSIISNNLFFGLGIISNKYEWEHEEIEKIVNAPVISFNEVIITASLEARYQIWRFKPSASINWNVHQLTKDIKEELIVYREKIDNPRQVFDYPLKTIERMPSSYTTLSIRPAIFFEINSLIDIGTSYTFYQTQEEYFSSDIEITTDEFKTTTFLFHLRFKKEIFR